MLSDDERCELDLIEGGLAGDRRLVDALATTRSARRRWPIRALVGFGILLVTIGILTGDGTLVLQGLLIGGAGAAWHWWRDNRATRAAGDHERSTPRPAAPPPD
jgi:Protein of unknown function (DUF3040)